MKVAVNRCYGGFGLSDEAFELFLDKKEIKWEKDKSDSSFFRNDYYHAGHIGDADYLISSYNLFQDRTDLNLISVIEELGEKANHRYSKIEIIEIPDDIEFTIEEYDGKEWVAEKHRTW